MEKCNGQQSNKPVEELKKSFEEYSDYVMKQTELLTMTALYPHSEEETVFEEFLKHATPESVASYMQRQKRIWDQVNSRGDF